jgi:hypothetical protein
VILDQRSAAFHPIAIIDVPDWADQALLGTMHMSTD